MYHAALQLKQKNELGVYLMNLTVSDLLYLASLPLWLQYIFQVNSKLGTFEHLTIYLRNFFTLLHTSRQFAELLVGGAAAFYFYTPELWLNCGSGFRTKLPPIHLANIRSLANKMDAAASQQSKHRLFQICCPVLHRNLTCVICNNCLYFVIVTL